MKHLITNKKSKREFIISGEQNFLILNFSNIEKWNGSKFFKKKKTWKKNGIFAKDCESTFIVFISIKKWKKSK